MKHSDEDSCETGWRLKDSQSLATASAKEIKESRRVRRTESLREHWEYCLQCGMCDIRNGEVIHPPHWLWGSSISRGAETCSGPARHDLKTTGVYRLNCVPLYLSSWPLPVRIPAPSSISQVKMGPASLRPQVGEVWLQEKPAE